MDYTLLVLPLTSHVILDMIWIQIIGVDLHCQLTAYLQDFGVIILQYVGQVMIFRSYSNFYQLVKYT